MLESHRLGGFEQCVKASGPITKPGGENFICGDELGRNRELLLPALKPCSRITPMCLGAAGNQAQLRSFSRFGATNLHFAQWPRRSEAQPGPDQMEFVR